MTKDITPYDYDHWKKLVGRTETQITDPVTVEKTILEEATSVVDGPRRLDYGHPYDNHGRTAAMWSAYLGFPITRRQVCIMNVLQKCARDANREKRDNLVDIAGWARNAELVEEPPQPQMGCGCASNFHVPVVKLAKDFIAASHDQSPSSLQEVNPKDD